MVLTAAAIGLGLANIVSTRAQGKRQQKMQEEAMRKQEAAQALARSRAASSRLAQAAESKRLQKRQPNAAMIMGRARNKQMVGNTFLSNTSGLKPLGSTSYVG